MLGTTRAMHAFPFWFPTFGLCLFVTLFRFGVLSVQGDLYPHYLASLDRYRIVCCVNARYGARRGARRDLK